MTVVHYHSQQPQNSIALDMEVPLYEVSVLLCSFLCLCELITLCELIPVLCELIRLLCELVYLLCELVPLRELIPMSV